MNINKLLFFICNLFLLIPLIDTYPQTAHTSSVEFLPPGRHFYPLRANLQEARIGIHYFTDNSNLKVDIGSSTDLIRFNLQNKKSTITIGIEFMAYALSTSYDGKRLQIDALDGLFGGNAIYSKEFEDSRFFMRLRFLHNSAHMVDGHFDINRKQWIDNRLPIPFARDFAELCLAHQIEADSGILRYYGSGAYSVLVRPSDLKRIIFNGGIEFSTKALTGNFLGKPTNIFIAYHISLSGTSSYTASNNLMTGVKFGEWDSKGVVFYLSYFAGNNMFSEYYYEKINRFGAGVTVELF